jgi:hypothetical protein
VAIEEIAVFRQALRRMPRSQWPFGFHSLLLDANRLRTAVKPANRALFSKAAAGTATCISCAPAPSRNSPVGEPVVEAGGGGGGDTRAAVQHALRKELGALAEAAFDIGSLERHDGDAMFLWLDGMTNMVPDEQIRSIFSAYGATSPRPVKRPQRATRGGRDNASAILVRYTS